MKICIINNIYPPYHRGGAEQVVRKTVEGLLDLNHEVFLLTTSPEGERKETEGNLTIYRTTPKNLFFYTQAHKHSAFARVIWHILDIWNVPMAQWVEEKIQEIQPDVVHTHNLMGMSFLIPRVIRKLHIKHVHTVHDVQLVEPSAMILKEKENSWRYNGLPTKLYAGLMKKLMGNPDVVISPSQFLLNFYKKWGFFQNSFCQVLRNPVTFDLPLKKKERKDEVFRFLYLGQTEYHKGIFMMLESFKKLNGKNVELHIVGSGSKFDELKELSKDMQNIILHGYMDREQLPTLFADMDVAIVPSICYENSPTVIFESLYFGLPVLSSDIEGIAELIEEGKNGFTFKTGDVDSLYEKMLWCRDHREEIEHMSKNTNQSLLGLSQMEYAERLLVLYQKKN
ncbi:MAG: glycosyltransferase family 4 protein [Candidatus Magasanikbacteria bacterium]